MISDGLMLIDGEKIKKYINKKSSIIYVINYKYYEKLKMEIYGGKNVSTKR